METTLLREETNIRELETHLKELKAQLNTSIDILQNELEYEQEYLNMVKWNKKIEFVRTKKELNDWFKHHKNNPTISDCKIIIEGK